MSNRQAEAGRIVWLTNERCFGTLVGPMGAYYSTVHFFRWGHEHEELMENNEFEFVEESI